VGASNFRRISCPCRRLCLPAQRCSGQVDVNTSLFKGQRINAVAAFSRCLSVKRICTIDQHHRYRLRAKLCPSATDDNLATMKTYLLNAAPALWMVENTVVTALADATIVGSEDQPAPHCHQLICILTGSTSLRSFRMSGEQWKQLKDTLERVKWTFMAWQTRRGE